MKLRMSSIALALNMFLLPLLALATPAQDCTKHPDNPNCPVIAMPEHWGLLESISFCAVVLIVFWLMARLKFLHIAIKDRKGRVPIPRA